MPKFAENVNWGDHWVAPVDLSSHNWPGMLDIEGLIDGKV